MTLRELLRVPYVRTGESLREPGSGRWVRRFEYPELPECAAEGESTVEVLDQLELARVARVLELTSLGIQVMVPRAPLTAVDVGAPFRAAGVDVPADLLDLSLSSAAGNSAVCSLAARMAAAGGVALLNTEK